MDPLKPRRKKGPEAIIQKAIIEYMTLKGWYIMVTHGDQYQRGFPDLFTCHSTYGQRWVEVKKPDFKGSKFTAAQLEHFPKLCSNGSGVWILTAASDHEYEKLFRRPNWWVYLESFR